MVRIMFYLLCIITLPGAGLSLAHSGLRCGSYELTQYRVTFVGEWSEEKFPKQYPKFRPHAQWSKLVGRTHNEKYNLWSLDKVSSTPFKKFAQEGASDELDKKETQGFNGIFDTFLAPAINAGVGESAVDIFVSHTHSMISAAVRLIPSPDWFVGVNGVELCVNGTWIREKTIELDPIDAGTDRGYTFTSPKWATRPRQPLHRITSKYPNHRANSFYYPELDALPRIASMKFELLTSNKLHKVHRHVGHTRWIDDESSEDDPEKKREELEEQQILHGEPLLPGGGGNDAERPRLAGRQDFIPRPLVKEPTSAAIRLRPAPASAVEDEDEELDDSDEMERPGRKSVREMNGVSSNLLIADQSERETNEKMEQPRRVVKKVQHARHLANGRNQQQFSQKSVHHHVRKAKMDERQDCIVGSWGPWSACSKTCGFGAQKRRREVIQAPKNGRPCPALEQEKWCGSMRACRDEQKLFSWLQNDNGNRKGRA